MKILKFGGSSVASAQAISRVLEIVVPRLRAGEQISVVFSASGKTTDQLIRIADFALTDTNAFNAELGKLETHHRVLINELLQPDDAVRVWADLDKTLSELRDAYRGIQLLKESTKRTLDFIMSFGERISAFIIAETLHQYIPEAEFLDARSLVLTDRNFGAAHVDFAVTNKAITAYFEKHLAPQIITGFIGATPANETTTLGRGGSDYTAAIFGAALGAEEVEIWTDVDGVLTADPRVVRKALPIDVLSYEEAMELSHFGAKVLYPPTITPLLAAEIPLRIKNTFNPNYPGTVIVKRNASTRIITGISSIQNIALLRVQGSGMVGVVGVSQRLFAALAAEKVNVIMITQASSEHSICLAVQNGDAQTAKRALQEEFHYEILAHHVQEIIVEEGLSIIAVVGENMRHRAGISGRLFQSLGKNGISVSAIAQGSSELNISFIVRRQDEAKALNALHDAFFLSEIKTFNLFLVGTGLVGSTLLTQIAQQQVLLHSKRSVELRVVGLCNSKKMLLDADGIVLEKWKDQLAGGESAHISQFISQMKELNLPCSIFVDCTANEDISNSYENILSAAISVVTPNKRANAGSLQRYQSIRKAARSSNAKYFYEANVGAGLPVIGTLNDLLSSGDTLLKIEAVLSGTLSYLFNSFSKSKLFSQVVLEAKERGYTEPDPRDDLSGVDVQRKLLILAREAGLEIEANAIEVENLVPPACRDSDAKTFLSDLRKFDEEMESRRNAAQIAGKVLRYIGTVTVDTTTTSVTPSGKAQVRLEAVGPEHPFYHLAGSDNVISFTTQRYHDRPLVIKGPGAGAAVTASGVFGDILRVVSSTN